MNRKLEIEQRLAVLGYCMAHSLSVLDDEGHAIIVAATGDLADTDELPPEVLALAMEWSRLESAELGDVPGDGGAQSVDREDPRGDALVDEVKKLVANGLTFKVQAESESEGRDQAVEDLKKLAARGLTFADCVRQFGVERSSNPYSRAAFERYHREGDLEFDDALVVSAGDDPGAYVMCWKWVSRNATGPVSQS